MLPDLNNAQPTLHNLHTVARLLGAVRVLVYERQPNYLDLGMKIVATGISTDLLPGGGEITLDFTRLALVYQPADGVAQPIHLEGQTQAELLETLLATIYTKELSGVFTRGVDETYVEAMFAGAARLVNHGTPPREHLSDLAPLHFNSADARAYAQALYSIFTGIARFDARLNGSVTPLVVWPEHFDLSFLWFAADADDQHPHLNFGFAPYSAGIDEPYLYAYAYPYPADFAPPPLPPGARWNTERWTGVVLPYHEISRQLNPEAFVEDSCAAIYRVLLPLLGT